MWKNGFTSIELLYTKISNWIQQFSVQNKNSITWIFYCIEVFLVILTIGGLLVGMQSVSAFDTFYRIGMKLGTIATLMLALTLAPGILKRLRWLSAIRVALRLHRKHFGILMYLTSVAHGAFVTLLVMLKYGYYPLQLFEVYGVFAVLLSFPLFVTSNDVSVRVLKTFWKKLHYLVYAILFFSAVHIWPINKGTAFILFFIVFFEVISYIEKYRYKQNLPQQI